MKQHNTLFSIQKKIKSELSEKFSSPIWILAEIGSLKVHHSGHCYLELVEKKGQKVVAKAKAMIWSRNFKAVNRLFLFKTGKSLEAGIKILAFAKVQYHEIFGLSIVIEDIDPNFTIGEKEQEKRATIERLKKLELWDQNAKLDFPFLPQRIAVIAAEDSAGFEDFNVSIQAADQVSFNITLYPSQVQGNLAALQIQQRLEEISQISSQFDVAIIIRGGGSNSDLAVFDDFELAKAIAEFPLPVITGIGHERDISVTDQVAFLALKTPTAVAEFLIQKLGIIAAQLNDHHQKIKFFAGTISERMNYKLEKLEQAIVRRTEKLLDQKSAELNYREITIETTAANNLNAKGQQLGTLANSLDHLLQKALYKEEAKLNQKETQIMLQDPSYILDRGYSVTLKDGKLIKGLAQLNVDDEIKTITSKGSILSTVKNINIEKYDI